MVQQRTPFLVLHRATEALGVVLQPGPADQQHVLVVVLQTMLQLMPFVPGHGSNDALRLGKRLLKRGRLAGLDLQGGNLQNHQAAFLAVGAICATHSRGAISVTERAAYIGRIRNLARAVAQSYYESRERLGFPMAPREWVAQMTKNAA